MDESTDCPEEHQERPINALRRQRLADLIKEFRGPSALAEATETTDTHLIACVKGRRGIGDKIATKLEAGAGKPFGWMDGGLSEEAFRFAQLFDGLTLPEAREAIMARLLQEISRDPAAMAGAPAPTRSPTSRHQPRS